MNNQNYLMLKRIIKEKLNYLILSIVFIPYLLTINSCADTQKPLKPNIIFILADDLGYGDIGVYGQEKIQTPNLDKMAKDGMVFTDFYSGSTVCAPSRCALMTGMHTGHSRVRGNYETGPNGFGAGLELSENDTTVAEVLQQNGYKTGLFGKWGLGVNHTTGAPNKKGFDEFFGYLNQGHAHFYYPKYLWHNDQKVELDSTKKIYSHDLITEKSIKFIKQNKDEPFFVNLSYTIPHAELTVPKNSLDKYLGKYEETPYVNNGSGGMGGYCSQEYPRATFAAMVSLLDSDIGRILNLLEELDIAKNTLVIFSSDNGPHKEGGADPIFFNSNGDLRGFKRDLYEGGIRVPMIAKWESIIEPNSKSNQPFAFWDILPTLSDVAGVNAPSTDGISFLPTLLNEKQNKHEYLYWEFHESEAMEQAVRIGKWKGVRHNPTKNIELYDLESDISESNDLSKEHPEIIEKIKNILETSRTKSDIWG